MDRVACPWLIAHFVDPEAEFLFVPADKVMPEADRLGAIPFDVPGVELGHHGLACSFEAILHKYELDRPTRRWCCWGKSSTAPTPTTPSGSSRKGQGSKRSPQAFAHLGYADDHAINAAEWIVYDALYAYCQAMVRQGKLNGAFAA